ncbi:hypothetical protein P7K49_029976 [Saguinus oedipus]|uniref:Uncharacterized protein n=1 Tax=Saguinus oedipus TaxID=9490 RepID=A0ABQ9U8R5_SAGOE|nr:hypothetical protein P7K49_029976 [Saguinus oedipus]
MPSLLSCTPAPGWWAYSKVTAHQSFGPDLLGPVHTQTPVDQAAWGQGAHPFIPVWPTWRPFSPKHCVLISTDHPLAVQCLLSTVTNSPVKVLCTCRASRAAWTVPMAPFFPDLPVLPEDRLSPGRVSPSVSGAFCPTPCAPARLHSSAQPVCGPGFSVILPLVRDVVRTVTQQACPVVHSCSCKSSATVEAALPELKPVLAMNSCLGNKQLKSPVSPPPGK